MPRHVDPVVEQNILHAARKLWHKGGEKGLSMRAVAKAAGTNTPAVYRRFRSRGEILHALTALYQAELYRALEPCGSLEEMADVYLKFALRHPREYLLIMGPPPPRMTKARPNLNLALRRCAEWFGGQPEQYAPLAHVLVSLVHGHAMLEISGREPWGHPKQIEEALMRSVKTLVANHRELCGMAE